MPSLLPGGQGLRGAPSHCVTMRGVPSPSAPIVSAPLIMRGSSSIKLAVTPAPAPAAEPLYQLPSHDLSAHAPAFPAPPAQLRSGRRAVVGGQWWWAVVHLELGRGSSKDLVDPQERAADQLRTASHTINRARARVTTPASAAAECFAIPSTRRPPASSPNCGHG